MVQAGFQPKHTHIGPCLEHLVDTLRALSLQAAADLRIHASSFADLPRGFRTFLPRPSGGSACKRLCMLARWMARRPGDPSRTDGIDLGIWQLPTDRLVVPLDTHIARLSLLLGLTRRTAPGWRAALEITHGLACLDPTDPLRYDFALAHLGISGACTVRRGTDPPPHRAVCGTCPLQACCQVGSRHFQPPPSRPPTEIG